MIPLNIKPVTQTPGTYYDSIQVSASGASNTPFYVPVTLTIEGVEEYEVATSPEYFVFTLGQDEFRYDSLFVYETHGDTVGFGFSNEAAWLTVEPLGMPPYATPKSLALIINSAGLTPGVYSDSILIYYVPQGELPQGSESR